MINEILSLQQKNGNDKIEGIQHILQYEGHRGPADVQFILKYGQIPSRYSESNFDPDLIQKSIQKRFLNTLTMIYL
ncbi:MAG: hypothetical protein IPM77_18870 [Crocinitomicaceae bacterium]|nr:hypothetical protein [Crocinitomicaceae bacterium]